MVARQIGECRSAQAHAIAASLIQRVRGDLHRDRVAAALHQLREQAMHAQHVRRREGERREPHAHGARLATRAANTERAEVGTAPPQQRERFGQQPGTGALAVGARHRRDGQLRRGRTKEAIGDLPQIGTQPRYFHDLHSGRQHRHFHTRRTLPENGARTGSGRVRGEAEAVRVRAATGEIRSPGGDLAAVERQIGDHQIGRQLGDAVQRRAQCAWRGAHRRATC
jgi:hypothetical protein